MSCIAINGRWYGTGVKNLPKIIEFEKAQREKRNGMSDEEIREMIKDMKSHMTLLKNGDTSCQELIERTKELLK